MSNDLNNIVNTISGSSYVGMDPADDSGDTTVTTDWYVLDTDAVNHSNISTWDNSITISNGTGYSTTVDAEAVGVLGTLVERVGKKYSIEDPDEIADWIFEKLEMLHKIQHDSSSFFDGISK